MALSDVPRTLRWERGVEGWHPSMLADAGKEGAPTLVLIDQRKLPHSLEYLRCSTSWQACDAIASLAVRGAPAIGVTGAYAVLLWALNEWPLEGGAPSDASMFLERLEKRAEEIAATRPTAVNLSWGVSQMTACARERIGSGEGVDECAVALEARAQEIEADDVERSRRIGEHGAAVMEELAEKLGRPLNVQTHCNAGSLATVHGGTATAVIYAAHERGLIANVWVDETRPVDQGARLTAWELGRAGVPYTLVCDDMAGSLMKQGKVDAVVVGADRICGNGDVANKIGTYQLAVVAEHHGVPFYVAAPGSTFDDSLSSGDEIVIEEREAREVRCAPAEGGWAPVAPQDAPVYNPAFDVTPAELVTAVIAD